MRIEQQAAVPSRLSRNNYRMTARIVGALYLAGMVVGIGGNLLIQSILGGPDLSTIAANSTLLAMGVVLWLSTVAGDAAHGLLMFPVLKPHSERAAVGYLGARIIDATFIAVMALLILVQIPLGIEYLNAGSSDTSYLQALSAVLTEGNLYAYEFAMITVGVAGLILCSMFYRTQLVPRLCLASPWFQFELDPGNPRQPLGAVYRSVADRQGVQHLVATPHRADHLINDTRRDTTARGQRYAVINGASPYHHYQPLGRLVTTPA